MLNVSQTLLKPDEYHEFKESFIDFREFPFPEVNPLKIQDLANYRYPSLQSKRKGIIFYIHGYGEYVQRYGYFAKKYAEAGYDFVGVDQRGFGYSQGKKGLLNSQEDICQDLLVHIDGVSKNYPDTETPKYLLGFSLGGFLTTRLLLQRPNYFKAVALLAPFFEFKHADKFSKASMPVLRELAVSNPNKKMMLFPMKPLPLEHKLHFVLDPLNQTRDVPAKNLYELNKMRTANIEETVNALNLPFYMCLGDQDQIVENTKSQKIWQQSQSKIKHLTILEGQDHMLFHDHHSAERVSSEVIAFFNSV
ncbi:hypothetical protein FGO68_gene9903 [Halteria grandinella]|uniref:Serine aminopeptidase S33 domain-containing protein n=1 Tax=Halteria grandinella TaxID=5974 RepID=A0A8J8NDT7_HALGN|nr:hypothetical protein FGO68_gene9903 [Halteria grandinella]